MKHTLLESHFQLLFHFRRLATYVDTVPIKYSYFFSAEDVNINLAFRTCQTCELLSLLNLTSVHHNLSTELFYEIVFISEMIMVYKTNIKTLLLFDCLAQTLRDIFFI